MSATARRKPPAGSSAHPSIRRKGLRMNQMQIGLVRAASIRPVSPPLKPAEGQFLSACVAAHAVNSDAAVANYIPELSKADPKHFCVALATIDAHVYEAGDIQV